MSTTTRKVKGKQLAKNKTSEDRKSSTSTSGDYNKERNEENEGEMCIKCSKDLSDGCKSMECDLCHQWVCIQCLEIPETVFDTLQTNPTLVQTLMVSCKECKSTIPTLKSINQKIDDNRTSSEDRLDKIGDKLQQMESNIRKTIKDSVKSEVKKQVESAIKDKCEELDTKMDYRLAKIEKRMDTLEKSKNSESGKSVDAKELNNKIEEAVQRVTEETREIEKRKLNIMIFKLKESTNPDLQERIKYDTEHFLKVAKLITKIKKKHMTVKDARRIGKQGENPRPLRVTLEDRNLRHRILNEPRTELEKFDLYKNVILAPDRTPGQRKRYKELKQELNKRKVEGEDDLIIKQNKIIKKPRTDKADHTQENQAETVETVDGNNPEGEEDQREQAESLDQTMDHDTDEVSNSEDEGSSGIDRSEATNTTEQGEAVRHSGGQNPSNHSFRKEKQTKDKT